MPSRQKFPVKLLPTNPALEVPLHQPPLALCATLGSEPEVRVSTGLSSRIFPKKGQKSVSRLRHSSQRHP